MIEINKREYAEMQKKGFINHIHLFKSKSKHPHYYMRESAGCMKALENYRNKVTVK